MKKLLSLAALLLLVSCGSGPTNKKLLGECLNGDTASCTNLNPEPYVNAVASDMDNVTAVSTAHGTLDFDHETSTSMVFIGTKINPNNTRARAQKALKFTEFEGVLQVQLILKTQYLHGTQWRDETSTRVAHSPVSVQINNNVLKVIGLSDDAPTVETLITLTK